MFVFFFSFVFHSSSIYEYEYVFRGNWTGALRGKNGEIIKQTNGFKLYIEKSQNISNINAFAAHSDFKNATFLKFPTSKLEFFGYKNPSQTVFYLFSLPKYNSFKLSKLLEDIKNAAEAERIDLYDFSKIHFLISNLTKHEGMLSLVLNIHDEIVQVKEANTYKSTNYVLNSVNNLILNSKIFIKSLTKHIFPHVHYNNTFTTPNSSFVLHENNENSTDLSNISSETEECNETVFDDIEEETDENITYQMKTFDLQPRINGTFINTPNKVTVFAHQFNHPLFVSEGKILGVITSIQILLNYVAWSHLSKNFKSLIAFNSLSMESFILHIGFDFSYTLFIFSFSIEYPEFVLLFSFIFVVMVSVYFSVQIKTLCLIWKATNNDFNEMSPEDIKFVLFKLFTEISFFMCMCSLAISTAFETPYVSLPLLYSFFIPQIVHSARKATKKNKDTVFIILVAIQRLIPVWYFGYYKMNLMEMCEPKVSYYITIYVAVQVFVLLLQNAFGGTFFLPKRFQKASFSYHQSIPSDQICECPICMTEIDPENPNGTMVTPCNHAFHAQCLSRWIEEQLVCPVCRQPIPPP